VLLADSEACFTCDSSSARASFVAASALSSASFAFFASLLNWSDSAITASPQWGTTRTAVLGNLRSQMSTEHSLHHPLRSTSNDPANRGMEEGYGPMPRRGAALGARTSSTLSVRSRTSYLLR